MRKRIMGGASADAAPEGGWLDLEQLAQVELTSEEPGAPIEAALGQGAGAGWRAAEPGPQTIRLIFDRPQPLRRVRLEFQEEARQRTQEFALRWSADGGRTFHDLLRQQYTFSPPGTTRQVEDYQVGLDGVTALELQIVPEIGGGPALASLARLRLA
ncbi:MAG TPA: hypothetical protein PKD53_14620 [Chloroflexaceae bacterium]|nr:hypothetical protein [Chloroflexaceae bacterium]